MGLAMAQAAKSPASHCGGPGSVPGQSI